ncbi:ENV1 protein, partial [Caloenas nicobarica]|nr:ENV1 protein [Caloenas nicobarica]
SDTNENSLWMLMNASYQVINRTYPNLTTECWLCFNPKPPYFEAIGFEATPRLVNRTNPSLCKWNNETQGISLQQVQGNGVCIG